MDTRPLNLGSVSGVNGTLCIWIWDTYYFRLSHRNHVSCLAMPLVFHHLRCCSISWRTIDTGVLSTRYPSCSSQNPDAALFNPCSPDLPHRGLNLSILSERRLRFLPRLSCRPALPRDGNKLPLRTATARGPASGRVVRPGTTSSVPPRTSSFPHDSAELKYMPSSCPLYSVPPSSLCGPTTSPICSVELGPRLSKPRSLFYNPSNNAPQCIAL